MNDQDKQLLRMQLINKFGDKCAKCGEDLTITETMTLFKSKLYHQKCEPEKDWIDIDELEPRTKKVMEKLGLR